MKKFLKSIGILAGLAVLAVIVIVALMPWMDRWGATDDEITASFSGDELIPSPRIVYTRAVSINASPEEIYPWIVQLGADKGGMYSYTWFETYVLQCPQANADRIHDEWQDLKVGDKVLMCPDVNAPPAFDVALVEQDRTIHCTGASGGRHLERRLAIQPPPTGRRYNATHPAFARCKRRLALGCHASR